MARHYVEICADYVSTGIPVRAAVVDEGAEQQQQQQQQRKQRATTCFTGGRQGTARRALVLGL